MVNIMALESYLGLMEMCTKGNSQTELCMVKVSSQVRKAHFIKVPSKTTIDTGTAYSIITATMRANGEMIRCMDMARKYFPVAKSIMDSGKKTSS